MFQIEYVLFPGRYLIIVTNFFQADVDTEISMRPLYFEMELYIFV